LSFLTRVTYPVSSTGQAKAGLSSPEHHAVPRTVLVQGGAGQVRDDALCKIFYDSLHWFLILKL
jgi:hypothetical protein